MDGTLTILGCGGSAGVPALGNHWGACDPAEPRNARTRTSVAIQSATTLVIVDTGPDFREQMNREKLGVPDAILITHDHSDHVTGLEELRILQRLHKRRFPVLASDDTIQRLFHRMGYIFQTSENGFYPAICDAEILAHNEARTVGDIRLQTFDQIHGSILSLGVRVGNIGYSTDVKSLPEDAYDVLAGVETWIVDACGFNSPANPVHAAIEEIIAMNARIGASKVYITHMPHTMDYMSLLKDLPPGYEPAYDGLKINFQT